MFLKWIARLPLKAGLEPSRVIGDCRSCWCQPTNPKPNPPHAMLKRHILPDFCRGGWALDKSFCQFQTRVAQENEKLQVQRLSHSNQKLPTHMHHSRSFRKIQGEICYSTDSLIATYCLSPKSTLTFRRLTSHLKTRQGKIPGVLQLGAAACASTHPEGSGFFFHNKNSL